MTIDTNNAAQGNQSMASVLLLYYHLLQDGGFGNDQTVYIQAQFDGFEYIHVEVSAECAQEIDRQLLREGAVISLLCDLQDAIGEHENDFLSFPAVQKIISSLANDGVSVMPEVQDILHVLQTDEQSFDHAGLSHSLAVIFDTYVVSRFAALAQRST